MKLDGENRIIRAMNTALKAQGWLPLSLCGLPICYAKNLPVTPYFFRSDVSIGPSGGYAIEGAIGIIDQEFEALWARDEGRAPKSPGFGVLLNILNVPKLQRRRHVSIDTQLEARVEDFCGTLAGVLATMPHDERGLLAALEKEQLGGFQLKAFSGYAYRSKFNAFWEFAHRLRKSQ